MSESRLATRAITWLLLCALLALAVAVRWIGLDERPLWLDEVITLNRASLPPAMLITDSIASMHYPSYFLLLAGVISQFGDSNLALRLPSLFFSALCVPFGYAIGRRIAGPVAGLATAALVALSPIQVMYAQEARSYALLGLLVMIALWGLVRLATEPGAASTPPRAILRPSHNANRAARTAWAAWAVGTAGALLVLNIAAFWLLASAAGLYAIRSQLARAERAGFDRTLMIAAAFIALMWLPWAVAVAPAVLASAKGFWAPPLELSAVTTAIWAVYLFGVADPVGFQPATDSVSLRSFAIAAAALLGAWSVRNKRAICWTLVVSAALPPLVLLVVSLVTPVFVPRYLYAGTPAFLVLAGCGVALLWQRFRYTHAGRVLAVVISVVAVADLSNNLRTYHAAELKPRWDLAAAALSESLQPSDRVLFHDGFARWVVETELRRAGSPLSAYVILDEPGALDPDGFQGRIWVPYGRVGHFAGPDDAEIQRWLVAWGGPASIKRLGQQVGIAIFEFGPPAAPDPSAPEAEVAGPLGTRS